MESQELTQEYCLQLIDDYIHGRADGRRHTNIELATFLDVNPVTISKWRAGSKMAEKTKRQVVFFCRKAAESSVLKGGEDNKTSILLSKILDAIMVSDMCAECKIKAYNIIKGVEG